MLEENTLHDMNAMKLFGMAHSFQERIAEYRVDPPPPAWNGVYVATSK